MLVSVQDVTKSFLDDVVLQNVSLDIKENDRLGLLGANGAGKTTLLNMIDGSLAPDQGDIVRARGLQIGYLRQNDALTCGQTLNEELRDAFSGIYALEAEMQACARLLASRPGDEPLLMRYDRLQAKFEAKDGYHVEDNASRVLNGLGFGSFDRETVVDTLSGGEKMRFGFAKMLLRQPDLLMLDEPTNHLDFNMLAWLEGYLSTYRGAVLVVSHDRYFLDAVAKDICEVEHRGVTLYHGGYSSFIVQKAERRLVAQRAYEKQQEEIAKMEDYVRRNMARASTSNMAKGRQKALDKLERLDRPQSEGKTISLQFSYDVEPFQSVLEVKNLSVSVGGGQQDSSARLLYTGIELAVLRGEKIAVVGENGVGKSTFLKAIQDMVAHGGSARWGGNVRLGYFDQELVGLPMDKTVLEAVHSRYPAKTEYEIRSLLGRLLLGGETVYKKVHELSGAMRAKVAFAILQMRRANVLVLDEPTNHLDYRAKEVLETALRAFTGTLLVVSHDRYFLRQVPTAILEMTPEGFVRTDGNFDDYMEKKRAGNAGQQNDGAGPSADKASEGVPGGSRLSMPPKADSDKASGAVPGGKRTREQRARDAQRRNRLSATEKEIEALEATMAADSEGLQSPKNASDYELLATLSERLKANTAALDTAMEEWLALTGEE